MTESFPFYDELAEASRNIISVDPLTLCSTFSSLEPAEAEVVWLLIYHHGQLDGWEPGCIPYSGTPLNQGVGATFELVNLPIPLQLILAMFISVCGTPV